MDDNSLQNPKILSFIAAEDFIGRTGEIDTITNHAAGINGGLVVASAPNVGLSELLRQCYDRLFSAQSETIPIYFSFSNYEKTAENAARRFLQTFLLQFVAFKKNDTNLLKVSPDVCELVELAPASDLSWINKLVSACEINSNLKDARSFVRQAFSAPLRAEANGTKVALFLDDFHRLESLYGETNLLEEVKEIYSRSSVSFTFAGRRRYILNAVQRGNAKLQNYKILHLDTLSISGSEILTEHLATKNEVGITEQSRDLLIHQFRSNPVLLMLIFSAAKEANSNLDGFQQIEKIYVDALLGGKLGKIYDSIFDEIAPNPEIQKKIIDLITAENKKTPLESWRKRLNLSDSEFYRIVRSLHVHELIRLNHNAVESETTDAVLRDYLESRERLENIGEQRALVVGNLLSESLKRAPQMMSKFYRHSSAIGLREILSVFNLQQISASLLDYSVYREKHKGAEEAEILADIEQENEKLTLPQVIYTASGAAFYPSLKQFSDEERTAVGVGFDGQGYTDESEIVWIAAEIDSKLEVSRELAEFWCDRLEMVAVMCNFLNYRLWLAAPEGFSAETDEVLRGRNAFGSSRRQVETLLKYLNAENLIKEKLKANEYEMVVPMGDDTEMIAAHAVEEIARRHHFEPKAITQIKTALVEACINAAEHSLSPDRKIYQRFTVEDNKIIITISNRGVKIPTAKVAESVMQIEPDEGRRGWGLKLMRNLMDEVKFEQVDDGTRISMTKYLKK
jgi:serine/threonine-protein kinase RsbW